MPPTEAMPAAEPDTVVATRTLDQPPAPPERDEQRSRRVPALLIGLVAVLAALAGVAWAQSGDGGVGVIGVPDLVGSEVEAATRLAEDAGLQVDTSEIEDDAPAGTVVDQSIPPGTRVASGTTFMLEVSTGCCTVPDLVGLDLPVAVLALNDAGLTIGQLEFENSDDHGIGTVIGQGTDSGSSVSPGDAVDLTVSQGDEKDKGKDDDDDDDDGGGPPGLRR